MKSIIQISSNWRKANVVLKVLLPIVIVVWFVWLQFFPYFTKDMSEAGQYGDMFGALNALFTGLALVGLFYTIFLQREQIDMLHKEARTTERYINIQIFESKFFHHIDLLQNKIAALSISEGYDKDDHKPTMRNIAAIPKLEGHQAISKIYSVIRSKHALQKMFVNNSSIDREEKINNDVRKSLSLCYGYYICSINVLRLIDNNRVDNAGHYAQLFVSLLSEDEKLLLVYYILRNTDVDHSMINRYHLLHGTDKSMLPAFVELSEIQMKPVYYSRAYLPSFSAT